MIVELSPPPRGGGSERAPRLVGDEGVWAFLCADAVLFALLFLTFSHYRAEQVAIFAASQTHLIASIGLINTLILVTSSWFVATAVRRARAGDDKGTRRFLLAAILCGVGFIAFKAVEYHREVGAGFTLNTDGFFMFYFVITGLHLVHVLVGLVVLVILVARSRRVSSGANRMVLLESGAAYWHLVDLLWIIIFPLLYLVR